jgi:hypothetical protein
MAGFNISELHPSMVDHVSKFASESGEGQLYDAYKKHQRIFWKNRTVGTIVASALALGTVFGSTALAGSLISKGAGAFAFFISAGIAVAGLILAYQRSYMNMSREEFEAIAGGMSLDETEMLYVSSFLTLQGGTLAGELRKELVDQLNHLMDAHQKVKTQLKNLDSISARVSTESAMTSDIERLEKKISSAMDDGARALYQDSLNIARKRSEKSNNVGGLAERVDAQKELVLMTLTAYHEHILSISGAPSHDDMALEGLRERIMSVSAHTSEIEAAVKELNAY